MIGLGVLAATVAAFWLVLSKDGCSSRTEPPLRRSS